MSKRVLLALLVLCLGSSLCLPGCGKRRAKSQTVSEKPAAGETAAAETASAEAASATPAEPEKLPEPPTPEPPPPATPAPEPTPTPEPTPAPPPPPRPVERPAPPAPRPAATLATGRCFFDLNQSVLTTTAIDAIDTFMAKIRPASVASVAVDGHCCDLGTDAYNVRLGQSRAGAVRAYLKQTYGLADRLFRIRSFGRQRPLTKDRSEAGRRKNRRAEIRVSYKK